MTSVADLLCRHGTDLPDPGAGRTAERFERLWGFGVDAPRTARLLEAHHDARAILREAGRRPAEDATFGVWAAAGPEPLRLDSGGRLRGTKHWCSGASLVSHALVTAEHGHAHALVLVRLGASGVRLAPPTWASPALADADTRTVTFDLAVDRDDVIGIDDWYLTRPGFWHGAVGVAACWAGCADGIVRRLIGRWPGDPHAAAHLGAIDSDLWAARAALRQAAEEIDTATSAPDEARRRALRVRHLLDRTAADVIDHVCRAVGPGPLAHCPGLHEAMAATDLYRRQCHAERDLETLGRMR